jgi:hypothetical protein
VLQSAEANRWPSRQLLCRSHRPVRQGRGIVARRGRPQRFTRTPTNIEAMNAQRHLGVSASWWASGFSERGARHLDRPDVAYDRSVGIGGLACSGYSCPWTDEFRRLRLRDDCPGRAARRPRGGVPSPIPLPRSLRPIRLPGCAGICQPETRAPLEVRDRLRPRASWSPSPLRDEWCARTTLSWPFAPAGD